MNKKNDKLHTKLEVKEVKKTEIKKSSSFKKRKK